MAYEYKVENLWRYLPWGFFATLLIWGGMIEQLAWHQKTLQPITAELIELPPPEQHIAIHSPPKPKPVRKNTSPQLPDPAQKPIVQQPIVQSPGQTPTSPSTPVVALPATNMTSGKDGIPYNVLSGGKSVAKSAQSSGNAITPPQFGAAYLNNPKPQYPPFARRMGIQGSVMLKVLVNKDGFSLKVEVAQSSGSDVLDEAAAEAVKKWRFVPARRGDQPVDEWVQVPVAFHLNR